MDILQIFSLLRLRNRLHVPKLAYPLVILTSLLYLYLNMATIMISIIMFCINLTKLTCLLVFHQMTPQMQNIQGLLIFQIHAGLSLGLFASLAPVLFLGNGRSNLPFFFLSLRLSIELFGSSGQLADVLTKSLLGPAHHSLLHKLGVSTPSSLREVLRYNGHTRPNYYYLYPAQING
ncbi:uncharacterized protein LOC107863298 isoform X1 [Capsicum annuum]|uniref:uncharacterized protein LOC107863298 isoform X1 n=1 Tax=Capsicum annuum TaxID=4072 RepID=UPI001FB10550|nr:uncharacterized protein LOC107863298 isoform X1 [Capsicum annuum]